MRAIIDAVLLAIIVYCTWMGYKKGIINSCIGILAIVVALYAGSLLSSAFSGQIIPAFEPFAGGIIESREDAAIADMGYVDVPINEIIAADPNAEYLYSCYVFEETGMHYRRANTMAAQVVELSKGQNVDVNDALEQVFSKDILYVGGTVLAAIIIMILFTVIASLANLTFHIPNAPKLETIGGAAAGFIKGFAFCVLLCWLLSFGGMIIGKDVLEKSLLTRFFLWFEFLTRGIL
jgi:hypothetical protein